MSKDTLIQGLNDDLAAEWGTILRYSYQASHAYGLVGAELGEIFTREIADEAGHARELRRIFKGL